MNIEPLYFGFAVKKIIKLSRYRFDKFIHYNGVEILKIDNPLSEKYQ